MKPTLLNILLMLLLSACGTDEIKTKYYENGSVKMKVSMSNGKRNGILYEYYEDGTLKSKGKWKGGMVNGEVKHYYKNGQLRSVSTYINNVQVGEAKYFYENGEILERQIFTDKGEKAYFVKFDTLGNIDTEAVLLIFNPEKDTVSIGENYKVNMHFGVDLSGEVELVIGKFDENYNLIDTTAVLIGNESKEFNYSIKSNKTGVNTVSILVHHVPNEGDTLSADGLIVKHVFFVKELEVIN